MHPSRLVKRTLNFFKFAGTGIIFIVSHAVVQAVPKVLASILAFSGFSSQYQDLKYGSDPRFL